MYMERTVLSENLVTYRFENNFAGIKIIIGCSSWLLEY